MPKAGKKKEQKQSKDAIERSLKADERKDENVSITPTGWKIILVAAAFVILFILYWAYTNVLEDKKLAAACYEIQHSPELQMDCSCRPTPKDAYDPENEEIYGKTNRGCTCDCILPEGTKKSFEVRIAR